MAESSRKGKFLSGWLFLLAGTIFAVVGFLTYRTTSTPFDRSVKLGTPLLMFLAAALQFRAGRKLPRGEA